MSVNDAVQTMPTQGSKHHSDWGFDLQCRNSWAVGLTGSVHYPKGHDTYFLSGFKLHCKDDPDTAFTSHYVTTDYSKFFDLNPEKSTGIRSLDGCVYAPHGHSHTYLTGGSIFNFYDGTAGQ